MLEGRHCWCSGNGGTQTCLPAACGVAQGVAQYGPSSSAHAQDPREGPSLAGRMTGSFLKHSLVRLAREEAERSRWGTSRGAHDASHENQSQAGARRAPTCAVSLFSLWCKEGKRRQGYQAKATFSVQRDQDQQDGRMEDIVEPKPASSSGSFGRRGPTLVRISVLDVPLQNGQLLAPFPLNIWEEARGLRL